MKKPVTSSSEFNVVLDWARLEDPDDSLDSVDIRFGFRVQPVGVQVNDCHYIVEGAAPQITFPSEGDEDYGEPVTYYAEVTNDALKKTLLDRLHRLAREMCPDRLAKAEFGC